MSYNSHLKSIAKLLYDDLTYEVFSYILRKEPNKVEDTEIAKVLTININSVRTSLSNLKSDGMVSCEERRLKKEEQQINHMYNNNMNNKNIVQYYEKNPDYMYSLEKKINVLKIKLKSHLDSIKKQKYKCRFCNEEYTEDKYAHYDHKCIKCNAELIKISMNYDDKLQQSAEVIIKELLNKFEGCNNEFIYQSKVKVEKNAGKDVNITSNYNPLNRLYFDLNSASLQLKLNKIDFKNEDQFKAFKELVLQQTGGNISI
jgi:transcription initiation factor IIE alpha subunit